MFMTVKEFIEHNNLDKRLIASCLGRSVAYISNYGWKINLMDLSVNQIVSLQKELNMPFNQILGNKVFTPQNIDTQQVTNNLAFNDKELSALKSLINRELQKDTLV